MQVSVESTGTLERKLTVTLPAERLQTQIQSRMRELGQTVRIKGFRPGKVPARVIEQRYGQQVRAEALQELVRDSFEEACTQQKLRPAVAPAISSMKADAGADVEYTATVEVMPELDTLDISGLQITRTVSSVEDADIDNMIDTLRQQRRSWVVAERASAATDLVVAEFSAIANGVRHPAEGSERVGTIIGSASLGEGFEALLTGKQADEAFTGEVSFPEGFRNTVLAGKTAKVEGKIVRVQESRLPELDDAFIASFGIGEGGLEKFRDEVRGNLNRELKQALTARLKLEVVDKLVAAHADVTVPKGMVEQEARSLWRATAEQAQRFGRPAPAQDLAPFMADAERRVRAGLLLSELARQNNLVLDRVRLAEAMGMIASTYEDPQAVIQMYQSNQQLMAGLQSRVLEDQVCEWIADHAKVTENKLGFKELMQPAVAPN